MRAGQPEAKAAVLLIKGMISELPQAQQEQIKELDVKLKLLMADYPAELASIAITLASSELAASLGA